MKRMANPVMGTMHWCGFGHSRFMWRLRVLPRIRRAFEAAWGLQPPATNHQHRPPPTNGAAPSNASSSSSSSVPFLVSFDGASLVLEGGSDDRLSPPGPHLDQFRGDTAGGLLGIQGVLLLTNDDRGAESERGGRIGFGVAPRSHRDFERLRARTGVVDDPEQQDLAILDIDEVGEWVARSLGEAWLLACREGLGDVLVSNVESFDGGCLFVCSFQAWLSSPVQAVSAQAGDLIMWDGRSTHQLLAPRTKNPNHNVHTSGGTKPPQRVLQRAAAYISMSPLAMADQEALRSRRESFERGRGERHAAHTACPLYGTTGGGAWEGRGGVPEVEALVDGRQVKATDTSLEAIKSDEVVASDQQEKQQQQ